VDEAHNLADRAREMYSAALSRLDVAAVQTALRSYEPATDGDALWDAVSLGTESELYAEDLEDLLRGLEEASSLCQGSFLTGNDGVRRGAGLSRERLTSLDKAVAALGKKCDRWLYWHRHHPLYTTVEKLDGLLRDFRTAVAFYDDRYVTFVDVEGDEVRVRLLCLDPSHVLRPVLDKAVGGILFSATLTPTEYFAAILGGGKRAVTVSFPSPFDKSNLCLCVVDSVSTRYEDRETSCRRIVSMIAAAVSAKSGNYMVYCPSYAYLEKVHGLFVKRYPKVQTVVQTPHMTAAERDSFIGAFQPDNKKRLVGFCVMGGLFSEGVDLPGRALIGAIIIGVGMPGISNERNIMKEYYDEVTEGQGYDYAYVYPGMNRVLQAAGRVIRRDEDRGIVVLIDDRYAGEPYLHLYPDHWDGMYAVGDANSLAEVASRFWKTDDM
jgi:Rad3-related DNA helicase